TPVTTNKKPVAIASFYGPKIEKCGQHNQC
ncbi:MAG: hypothetical protein ACJA0M_001691, partial [Chitinophagales bacterium]